MDSFSVATTYTLDDWKFYQGTVAQRAQAGRRLQVRSQFLLISLLTIAIAIGLLRVAPLGLSLGSMVAGVLVAGFSLVGQGVLTRNRFQPDENGSVLGPRTLTLSSAGCTSHRTNTTSSFAWSACREVEIVGDYLFMWLDRMSGQIVPFRDLPPGMTPTGLLARINAFRSQKPPVEAGHQPVICATPSLGQPASTDGTVSNPSALRRALGFLSLHPIRSAVTPVSDWAIASCTVGSLILWIALDRLRYGSNAELVPYDAPGFAWYMLPVLLAAWLASRLTQPRVEFRNILFLLVLAAPVVIGSCFLLQHNVPRGLVTAYTVIFVIYAIVYLEKGLHALAGRGQHRAVTGIIAIILLFVSVNSAFYFYPTLWSDPDPDATADNETQVEKAEDLLVSQGSRIQAELGRVTPTQPGTPSVYFVGFAGVGSQKVFADEIKLAAQRISERYDSGHRTVLLLNDHRDVDSHPIATVEGLKLALKGVAAKMDVEQDVLFLSLSSRGSDDPSLAVSNLGVSLRDLSGSGLAEALHSSGIKWKIIIISACHAGAFIDTLRDDNSIILTAAATDRTSFGCRDDRELTYFGEAFYRDALPRSTTLQQAFSYAKAYIAVREQSEHIRASNPQDFIGAAMLKKLAAIDSTAHCNTGCRQSVPESHSTRP